jgi:CHAT domain-containing protein
MTEFQFVARDNLEKAFYYAELSRNRELFDAIATQSEIRWDSNQATLEYAASDESLDLKQIRDILPDNAQLVEYAITDRHLLVWLVTNSFWKSYSIPISDQQLRQLCAEYLAELQNVRRPEALSDKAADLHSKLIKPLADDLDPNRILVIVPDGILGAIPFPALFSAESQRYLIQDYAIVTIPSAGILSHTLKVKETKNGKQPESLLVLSNPKLDAKQFPSLRPLPATEREAAGISSQYAASLGLSREQATKSMLLQNINRYSVIHLATHSIVNEQNPLLSSVILSPEGESPSAAIEGNLRAFEIFGLHLTRPRLVILSSCRSGLSVQSASNGLGGLAHAFFKAGVPAVIASLWEVEDQSAAELMKSFHYSHRVEKQSFCQALRSAQLQMLTRQESPWKHPYYWAAFQFSGNGFTS